MFAPSKVRSTLALRIQHLLRRSQNADLGTLIGQAALEIRRVRRTQRTVRADLDRRALRKRTCRHEKIAATPTLLVALGVLLHAMAGDRVAEKLGAYAPLARELADAAGEVLGEMK